MSRAETPLRAAIIGAGKIAGALAQPQDGSLTTHAAAMRQAGVTLAAICDRDIARAQAFAGQWGAMTAFDHHTALGTLPQLDVVVIATPDGTHAGIIGELMALPQPPRVVICEKPLCVSREQLNSLHATVHAHPDVMLVVNHSRRFDANHRALQAIIASGGLGDLVDLRWVYYGGWLHNGVHALDTIQMLLACPLSLVSAVPGWQDRDDDRCLDVQLQARDWPAARIAVESFPETAYQLFEGELRFARGRIRLLDFGAEVLIDHVRVNAAGERELKVTERVQDGALTAMQTLYQDVIGFLRDQASSLDRTAGFEQTVITMDLLFAAKEHADR